MVIFFMNNTTLISGFGLLAKSIFVVLLSFATFAFAEVDTFKLQKSAKFDGLLFHDNRLFAAAGWDGSLIYEINGDGSLTTLGVIPKGPIDMVSDGEGNLVITSYGANAVYKLDQNGGKKQKIAELPTFAGSIINYKTGEYIVGSGGLLYLVSDTGRVDVFFKDIERIDNPTGLTTDEHGNIYVGNLAKSNIFKIAKDTKEVVDLTTLPVDGQYNIGKLIYADGYLYATHLSKHAIYRIDSQTGETIVWAGEEGTAAIVDGDESAARFKAPNGIALDKTNNTLWIAPAFGRTSEIRKLDIQ